MSPPHHQHSQPQPPNYPGSSPAASAADGGAGGGPPTSPFHSSPASNGPSGIDALAIQIQRMQQMQDWMLWQKESECQQLRQRLDEACRDCQQLKIDNALLQEKLHQQEQRMQHELKLIKFAASQQRKNGAGGGNNNKQLQLQHQSNLNSNSNAQHENRLVAVSQPKDDDGWQQQWVQPKPEHQDDDDEDAPVSVVETATTTTNGSMPNHPALQQHVFPHDPMEGFSLTAGAKNRNSGSSPSRRNQHSRDSHNMLPPKAGVSSVMPSPASSTVTRATSDCHDSVTTDSEEGKDAFDSQSITWPTTGSVASAGGGSIRGATARATNPKQRFAYKNKVGPLTAVGGGGGGSQQKPGPSPPRPSDKRPWKSNSKAAAVPFPLQTRQQQQKQRGSSEEDKKDSHSFDDGASTEQQTSPEKAQDEPESPKNPWKNVALRPVATANAGTTNDKAVVANESNDSSNPPAPTQGDVDHLQRQHSEGENKEDAADDNKSGTSSKDAGVPTDIDVDGRAPPAVPLEENVTFGTMPTAASTPSSPVGRGGGTSHLPSSYSYRPPQPQQQKYPPSSYAGTQQQQQQQQQQQPPKAPYSSTYSTPLFNTSTASSKVSFVDDSASVGHTVASSTIGEDRVNVVNKIILDPYGDKGAYTGIVLRSTGMPHGSGEMIYQEDKRTYSGEWRHGRWHGFGRASFANGDNYEGEYRFDQRHGRGVYQWNDGRVYDGMFREDKRHGKGKFVWPDGAVYEGEFKNGQREGQGTYIFSDGGKYEGSWKDGRYSGYGVCSWEDGRCYKGEWLNGMAHGKGIETFADGTIRHDGLWEEDEPVEI